MVFSLFGKKPPEPSKPSKPAVKQPPAPAQPAPGSDKSAVKPAEDKESLDFTGLGAFTEDRSAQDQIEIHDSSAGHPVVEEAAILYANGQDAMALAALEGAVNEGNLGAAAEQIWAMLFDLYLLMGKREAFETRALEYSVRFEKSPPTWLEPAKERTDPKLGTGGQAFVAFGTDLNGSSEKAVRQLEKIIAANPLARLDVAKIQSVDDAGCEMLLRALKLARKHKCEVVMSGAEEFAQVLGRLALPSMRSHEPAWLLLLELYQHMGRQEAFDDMALQYAITFEVSPPSWEKLPVTPKKKAASPPSAAADAAQPGSFPMAGEIFSGSSEIFHRLSEYADGCSQVTIDCSGLKRMDFVSAGIFLNALTKLQAAGKPVAIRAANAMIYALFGVLGINQVAQVERRKL
ncbi:MAG: STAS domain-containing protein [Pseudomonadota bacterium]